MHILTPASANLAWLFRVAIINILKHGELLLPRRTEVLDRIHKSMLIRDLVLPCLVENFIHRQEYLIVAFYAEFIFSRIVHVHGLVQHLLVWVDRGGRAA